MRSVTEQPVRYVVYSHSAFDHSTGGAAFADTARFVGHRDAVNPIKAAEDPTTPAPDITFDTKMNRTGRAPPRPLPADLSPTDDYIVIHDPAGRVAMFVDLVQPRNLPFRTLLGHPERIVERLQWIESALEFDVIVSGHATPQMTGAKQVVVEQRRYHGDLSEAIATARAAGLADGSPAMATLVREHLAPAIRRVAALRRVPGPEHRRHDRLARRKVPGGALTLGARSVVGHAAVRVDGLAGDEAAVVGDQEQTGGGDLIHRALAPQGNAGGARRAALVPLGIGARGVDAARRDHVDPDVLRGELGARPRASPTSPIFAAETWARPIHRRRPLAGDEQDAPIAVLDHRVDDGSRAIERSVENDSPDGLPVVHRQLGEGLVGPDRGIVDENVDPAELGERPGHHRLDLVPLGDVGNDGERLDAAGLGFPRHGVRFGLVGASVDDDVSALAASVRTIARPMFRPEPVTSAILPSSTRQHASRRNVTTVARAR